jgi:hypothetical protein
MAAGTLELEFIKALIEYYKDDARQIYLRVTGALAIATLFVTQIPIRDLHALSYWPTLALFAGLGSLAVAALLYFYCVTKTHYARKVLACCLLDLDAKKAKGIQAEIWVWHTELVWWGGEILFGVGILLLGYVLWALVA